MGKKRKTGKKEGVFLTILVLFCTFLTGCAFLDIRDGGQESPKKKLRLPGLPRRGKHH